MLLPAVRIADATARRDSKSCRRRVRRLRTGSSRRRRVARADQVLHDFLLAVHHDRAAAGQRRKVDAVGPAAAEAQLDAVVRRGPRGACARRRRTRVEEIDGALLQHAGAHAMLDVIAVAVFEDDRIDARAMQQMRQHQAGRARARAMPTLRAAFASVIDCGRLGVPAEEQAVEIGIVQELGRRTVERQAAHLEHQRAVRVLERGAHVLLDHQHRDAAVGELAQQRHHVLHELGRQADRRLVDQEHARTQEQRAARPRAASARRPTSSTPGCRCARGCAESARALPRCAPGSSPRGSVMPPSSRLWRTDSEPNRLRPCGTNAMPLRRAARAATCR